MIYDIADKSQRVIINIPSVLHLKLRLRSVTFIPNYIIIIIITKLLNCQIVIQAVLLILLLDVDVSGINQPPKSSISTYIQASTPAPQLGSEKHPEEHR